MNWGPKLLPALLAFWVGSAAGTPQAEQAALAVVGGRLIDGFGGKPLENSVILIQGNRISAIGEMGKLPVPEGARVVSSEGMTVLPGLMDMHVHLMILGHADYEHWFKVYPDQWRDVVMPISARELLLAGVTTARDVGARLGDILPVRERINRGEIPGPRLFVSGPFLQKQVPPLEAGFRWKVEGPADARRKTQTLIQAGVDLIKVIDQDQMSLEELKAIVETAHAAGLHVTAHAHRPEEIRQALRAGVDCLEHTGLAAMPTYPDDVLAMIAERNASLYWCPTMEGLFLYQYTEEFPERLDESRLKADLPPEMYQDVRTSVEKVSQLEYFRLTKRRLPTVPTKFEALRRAGVTFVVGTDSGIPLNFHYDSTWRELATMVRLGMNPMEAIRAATYWPARLLKKEKELGTLAPGKLADLIVVDGDPLTEINSLRHVVHVIKDGVVYK